jgi:magnesium-transporting ATPase (P-type)
MGKILKFQGKSFFNLLLTILGIIIMIFSLQLGFGTLNKPGPGFFPFFCGGIIFFQSAMLLLAKEKSGKADSLFTNNEIKNLILMTIIFISWIVLMPFSGYLLVTFLASLSFSKVLRLEGWRKPIILSIGITTFCYFLFDVYLYVDLPRGLLP